MAFCQSCILLYIISLHSLDDKEAPLALITHCILYSVLQTRLAKKLLKMAGNSEDTFSMVDVLEEDRELEEEANAVLGASDDQNCTYPQVSVMIFLLRKCCRFENSS